MRRGGHRAQRVPGKQCDQSLINVLRECSVTGLSLQRQRFTGLSLRRIPQPCPRNLWIASADRCAR